jgi:hypothetical protein
LGTETDVVGPVDGRRATIDTTRPMTRTPAAADPASRAGRYRTGRDTVGRGSVLTDDHKARWAVDRGSTVDRSRMIRSRRSASAAHLGQRAT